jgi:hypothetical protein
VLSHLWDKIRDKPVFAIADVRRHFSVVRPSPTCSIPDRPVAVTAAGPRPRVSGLGTLRQPERDTGAHGLRWVDIAQVVVG